MILVKHKIRDSVSPIYTKLEIGWSKNYEWKFTYSGFSCPTTLYGLMTFFAATPSPYYLIRDKARKCD